MKAAIFSLLLLSSTAFAFDICSLQDTNDFSDFAEQTNAEISRTQNHNYNALERKMILEMMKLDPWREITTEAEAVRDFSDMYGAEFFKIYVA
jgi:chloramphenicol O-acetyltransferase